MPACHLLPMMFTPRATTSPTVSKDIRDSSMVSAFARRERTMVSVGLKAVAVLNARKR